MIKFVTRQNRLLYDNYDRLIVFGKKHCSFDNAIKTNNPSQWMMV